MTAFAVNPQKVADNQTNFIYPMNCSVSGLKPNSTYDFYVDGKKRNDAVMQGSGKAYTGSGSVTGLKSDAAGKCNFTFFPVIINGFSFNSFGFTGRSAPLPKKLELRGPDNTSVSTNPAKVNPSNPVVYAGSGSGTTTVSSGTQTQSSSTVPAQQLQTQIVSTFNTAGVDSNANKTPLSEASLYFDYIQSFYIDPSSVAGSQTVSVSDVELFFKQKPDKENNQSQILNPGVYVYICQMQDGQPNLSKVDL